MTGGNDHVEAPAKNTKTPIYAPFSELVCAAAGRLSYSMNLQGPCLAIDTGCSATLVAMHQGSAALRLDECIHAFIFGINVLTAIGNNGLAFGGVTSYLGRCHTFDLKADGY